MFDDFLRRRLELGPPVGFYAHRFFIADGQQIKIHSFSKIKKRVKYTTIRAWQAKSFGNISFYDRCRRSVHSAREGIKIKLALFMAQSIPSVPIPLHFSGICHFVLEKLQMPHGGAGRTYKKPPVGL